MRLPIQLECIIYRKSSSGYKFLLLKRLPEKGGFWQFVTGGLEDTDKDMLSGCFREIQEETGIREKDIIRKIEDVYFFQFRDEDIVRLEYVYGFEVKPEVKVNIEKNFVDEHSEYRWVEYEEALKLLKWNDNKTALKKLKKELEKR